MGCIAIGLIGFAINCLISFAFGLYLGCLVWNGRDEFALKNFVIHSQRTRHYVNCQLRCLVWGSIDIVMRARRRHLTIDICWTALTNWFLRTVAALMQPANNIHIDDQSNQSARLFEIVRRSKWTASQMRKSHFQAVNHCSIHVIVNLKEKFIR